MYDVAKSLHYITLHGIITLQAKLYSRSGQPKDPNYQISEATKQASKNNEKV
jgi:hypothetical protein